MNNRSLIRLRKLANSLIALFLVAYIISFNISPAMAYAGTLENGNLAFAQSEFNKGAACNYLPGFETGYDAWHFVLTTRGATFQQDPRNPAVAVNLNFVFMRLDGSLFVIKSGAWVQTGKGAYTYTVAADRIRMVQAGSLAIINGSDSGIRLSHTCPGSGSVNPTTVVSQSPTPTPSPTATTTRTPTPTPSPSPTATTTRTPTPTPSPSPTATVTPSSSPSPTTTTASTPMPTLRPRPSVTPSAIQITPSAQARRNVIPTPSPSIQPIGSTPTPSPSPTPTRTNRVTTSPSPSESPSVAPEPTTPPDLSPPVLPVPPQVEDPKNVIYVDPQTPKVIDPQTFPEPPSSPIEITKSPEYGTLVINTSGTITYTPNLNPPPTPVVDVVELKYTNLSGATVVLRREFVLTQKGDVPRIIQTGSDSNQSGIVWLICIALVVFATSARKRGYGNV